MEINYRFLDANSDSEITQWLELYQICYQHHVSREFWYWIHMENPYYKKTKPLIFIAELNKKIVGSASLIPSPIHFHNHQTDTLFNSCLLCKAMVHPEFRNRGIFNKLIQYAIETLKSEGYDILLTVSNNPYSYHGVVKTGFQDVTSMKWSKAYVFIDEVFQKYIQTLKIPPKAGKILIYPLSYLYGSLIPHQNHHLQIKSGDVAELVGEVENFHRSTLSNQGIYGVRTTPFIKWRFSRPGTQFMCLTLWKENTMLAYLIIDFLDGGRNALIADMCVKEDDKSLIAILVSEGIHYCKKYNVHLLLSYVMDRDSNAGRFFSFRNGFLKRSSKKSELSKSRFLYYSLNDDKPMQAIFSDKNNWNIQSVDTCLFW